MGALQRARPAPGAIAVAIWDALARPTLDGLRAVAAGYRARRAACELRELSDRMLADIGLTRDQLDGGGRLDRRL